MTCPSSCSGQVAESGSKLVSSISDVHVDVQTVMLKKKREKMELKLGNTLMASRILKELPIDLKIHHPIPSAPITNSINSAQ